MSADHNAQGADQCRIDGPRTEPVLEFKSFTYPLVGGPGVDLAVTPGAMRRDAAGRATLLHFAPGRFLLPAPTPDLARQLDSLAQAGVGVTFDVDGKWRELTITGSGVHRLLSSGADVAAVLAHRECAALYLFDCPVVLARRADGFDVWVQASYATDFRETLDRIRRQR